MKSDTSINELVQYVLESPTPYHAVDAGIRMLRSAGFTEWKPADPSPVIPGAKLYVSPYPTCLFAFSLGSFEKPISGNEISTNSRNRSPLNLRIAGAHTDSPCFHIKPVADAPQKKYLRLNVDVYGGPILNTWLDRPLSIAGAVALRSDETPLIHIVDLKAPLLTIPNLAIHMNREVNKGVELNPQNDLLPLLGLLGEKASDNGSFLQLLAQQLSVNPKDILDFDLFVYNTERPLLQGMNSEFLSAPRLDNLTSCHALLKAVSADTPDDTVNIIALYDNEEVGSRTARGADSNTLLFLLENLYEALGRSHSEMNADILKGTLLSVDVAHALHPNACGKYDPDVYALMNEGVVFKLNSSQRYVNNLEALSGLELLCESEQIPYKKFVNRADAAGGSTIGNKITGSLPMCGLDLGVPILAMHSARELMGVQDQTSLERLVTAFFRIK